MFSRLYAYLKYNDVKFVKYHDHIFKILKLHSDVVINLVILENFVSEVINL